MANTYKNPYLESTVWLGWIKGEVCEGVDRKQIVDDILSYASQGAYPIHTSAVTLAEVHKTRGGIALASDMDEAILNYFEHNYIRIVAVDREIGEQANKLCRDYGLETCDALHLASALRARCDYLLTWDDKLLRCTHPNIWIAKPEIMAQPTLMP